MNNMKMKNRTDVSFLEAVSIVIGHGIGAGILSVPYLASRNSLTEVIIIIAVCALFNILLHLLISELSLNNKGAQFVSCFKAELFTGKLGNAFTWVAFILVGLSVIINVSAYLTGAAAVFSSWFGLNKYLGILLFYVICSIIVYAGVKLVGICEKYAVAAMIVVVLLLLVSVLSGEICTIGNTWQGINNALALFSIVSFSLSAVMCTPIVVNGLNFDAKRIRRAIICGILTNTGIITLVTFTTLLGVGNNITEDGALVDLAKHMGGWVSIVGYVFTLLALATSFWTSTLNLRNIISEQLHMNQDLCWLFASLPPLAFAMLADSSFVALSRIAGIILVVTSLGIILSYNKSRKRIGSSPLLGGFGRIPFQIIVVVFSLLASLGSVLTVK